MNDARDRVNDYLGHIIAAIERIRRYTTGMDRGQFLADERTQDAVVKNLENIGEATNRIQSVDTELTLRYPGVPLPIVWTRFCNSGRLSHGVSLADFKG